MQTAVETVNSYLKKITVELDPEELQPLEKKIVKKYRREASIPGFRPGRAPESIIKKRYGDLILQDIADEAISQFYFRAIQETKLEPVSTGKIVDLKFNDVQEGMRFVIELEVQPEFELKKYKGLRAEKEVLEVTEEMVEDTLQKIREQYATVKEVEEAAEGHFLYFDVQELDRSQMPIIGHKYENMQVQLGSGKFDPELEEQLIGIKTGEKRIVRKEELPVPGVEDAEPKVFLFEIHAKKIEEKEYPELDDEFVKNLGNDTIETLAQLKEHVRKDIEINLRKRIEDTFTNRVIDELLKENPFEVPPSMVDNYLDNLIKDYKKQVPNQEVDEEKIREQYRATAIHELRWYLLMKKIIEVENIEVTNEEIEQYIDSLETDEKSREMFKKDKRLKERIKDNLLEQKVLNLLKENAEVIEIFPQQASRGTVLVEEIPQEKSPETKAKTKAESEANKIEDAS